MCAKEESVYKQVKEEKEMAVARWEEGKKREKVRTRHGVDVREMRRHM